MAGAVKTLTARARLRELVKDEVESRNEIHVADLAKHLTGILRADKAFLKAFVDEVLPSAVYEEVQKAIGRTRSLVRNGDYAATGEVMAQRRERFASRFERWYEHSGGRTVKLLEMTREDLLAAAEERRKRGDTEIRIARLWETLANGLEGGQSVGDRFTTDEIESRYSEIEGETAS